MLNSYLLLKTEKHSISVWQFSDKHPSIIHKTLGEQFKIALLNLPVPYFPSCFPQFTLLYTSHPSLCHQLVLLNLVMAPPNMAPFHHHCVPRPHHHLHPAYLGEYPYWSPPPSLSSDRVKGQSR